MTRFLTRLLVLLLVPVVAWTYATPALADSYGSVGYFSASEVYLDESPVSDFGGWEMVCSGSAAYVASGTTYAVTGKVVCDVDVREWNDPDPGDLENGTVTVSFKGTLQSGQSPCGYNMGPLTGDVLSTQAFTTVPTTYPCLASEVCIEAYTEDNGTFARHDYYQIDRACSPIQLGALPSPSEGQCAFGTPTAVDVARSLEVSDPTPTTPDKLYKWRWRVELTVLNASNPTKWRVMPDSSSFTASNWGSEPTVSGTLLTFQGIEKSASSSDGSEPSAVNTTKPTVMQIYSAEPASGNTVNTTSYDPSAGSLATIFPPTMPDGAYRGLTQPEYCRFWAGPKVVEFTGTTADDPLLSVGGPPYVPPGTTPPDLTPDPPETGDPCDFSFSDPTTWVSAGICKLVEILRSIKDAIVELPGKIVELLKDALEALFVPEDGFIDGKIDDLSDAFDDSTIGNYLEVFRTMVPPGSSGCAGPTISLPIGGTTTTGNPLSACSGTMATAATVSRLVITIAVGLSASFAVVRILGRSLGWDPGLGGDK